MGIDKEEGGGAFKKLQSPLRQLSRHHSLPAKEGKPDLERPWYYIDTTCIPDKVSYMIEEMRFACHLPFLITIFTSFGLDKSQAGLIAGLRLIGTIIGNSFWGMLADKTKKHKLIVLVQVSFASILFCSQPLISMRYSNKLTNRCSRQAPHNGFLAMTNTSMDNNSSSSNNFNSTLNSTIVTTNNNTSPWQNNNYGPAEHESNKSQLFWILLFLNIATCFFDGSIPSFLDAAVVRKIEATPYKVNFGTQRKFGTLGYAAGIILTNAIIDSAPNLDISCSSLVFAIYPVFILLELGCIEYMLSKVSFVDSSEQPHRSDPVSVKGKDPYFRILFKTCKQTSTLVFFCTAIIYGIELSSKAIYVVSFLEELKAPALLFTLFFICSSLFIFIGLELSSWLTQKLNGSWNALVLVFFAYAVKFFGYIYTPNTWALLVFEALDFFTQGLAIPVIIGHVHQISPTSVLTSMFALTSSLIFGYGFIIGGITGGYLYENYGGKKFYGIHATLSMAWTVVLVLYRFVVFMT